MQIVNRLKGPLAEDSLLTRYVDIHGFLYFITQSKLRFARLDTFEDMNEGFSIYTAEAARQSISHSREIKQLTDAEACLQEISLFKKHQLMLEKQYRKHQEDLFACCWYMGEKESVAMWNLYSNHDSVAIRFNANALIELISSTAGKENPGFSKLFYGPVEYLDLGTTTEEKISEPANTGFIKDDSFSHEYEFRFMAQKTNEKETFEFELCIGDLKQIDFTIITHPKMEEWKIRNILKVLACYQLAEKFQPSQLALKHPGNANLRKL